MLYAAVFTVFARRQATKMIHAKKVLKEYMKYISKSRTINHDMAEGGLLLVINMIITAIL